MDYNTPSPYITRWPRGNRFHSRFKQIQDYGTPTEKGTPKTPLLETPLLETPEETGFLGSAGKRISAILTLSTEKVKSAIKSAKKFVYQGKKTLKDALQKLQDTVPKISLSKKLLELITKEKRDEIFGKLPEKCKIKTRDIAEPFNAGSVQGPTLYGVGTGKAPVKNVNYSTYLDDNSIPMCWGFKIPLSFGLGGKDKSGESKWTGRSGGGTNHEMEHAIKCVTQCMLNGLAQRKTYKKEQDIKAHNLLHAIFEQIGVGNNKRKISRVICQLLRKQQVIAGLPSCSLFNQIKCDIDLIKLSLLELPGNKEWFYAEVAPNKQEITRIVKEGICKDSRVKLTWCSFYGILANGLS